MPTKKAAAAKKAAPKKTAAKKTVAKKAAPKKAAAKKAAPKKAAVKKAAPKKAATKKATTSPEGAAPPPLSPLPYAPATEPDSVVVSFEGPGPQRRLTVAFRIILALPHVLFLYVLNLVAYVVVIIGWFGALFTGHLPKGMDTFLARIIQQFARVYGYTGLLLTDRYPSFALDEPDYPVSVDVTPTPLNRWAVLGRIFLVIPAAIVMSVVIAGLAVASFVVWLIVLIAGRLPAPVFEAEAAVLRFQVRFYAYAAMLTSEYPRGLFGDRSDVDADAPTGPIALTELPSRPRITRLVLSKAAKRLVVLFLVLGVVFGVGAGIASAVNVSQTAATSRDVARYHEELGAASQRFSIDAQACVSSGGIDCLHAANLRLATAFERFGHQIEDRSFPTFALSAATQVRDDAAQVAAFHHRLASLQTAREYQAAAGEYTRLATKFDEDYRQLVDVLGG